VNGARQHDDSVELHDVDVLAHVAKSADCAAADAVSASRVQRM
jgi:hypothetical protein